ncbi:hypothetical protein DMX02_23045 [Pseudomonas jessenii]|nr:hypothetical protein DMX02_23045 [Pseudomonas jessenii]
MASTQPMTLVPDTPLSLASQLPQVFQCSQIQRLTQTGARLFYDPVEGAAGRQPCPAQLRDHRPVAHASTFDAAGP